MFISQEILRELVESGNIKARTKWKEVYPLFSKDKRYLDILGNPGSNPLELFWDVVDSLDQKLDQKLNVVEAAIKRHNDNLPKAPPPSDDAQTGEANGEQGGEKPFKVVPETTKEEFLKVVGNDEAVKAFAEEELDEIYRTVRMIYHDSYICS